MTADPAGAGVLSSVAGRMSPDERSTETRDSMFLRLCQSAEAWRAPGWTARTDEYGCERFVAEDGGQEWFMLLACPSPRLGASLTVRLPLELRPPAEKVNWHETAHFPADKSTIHEAALCAVVAGILSRGGFNPRTVRELARFETLHVRRALPRPAHTLCNSLMDAMHRAAGHHVVEARARVMTELPLLTRHMGEDEWMELYRMAAVAEVHRS